MKPGPKNSGNVQNRQIGFQLRKFVPSAPRIREICYFPLANHALCSDKIADPFRKGVLNVSSIRATVWLIPEGLLGE